MSKSKAPIKIDESEDEETIKENNEGVIALKMFKLMSR